jgi:hypothetical protein
MGSFRPSTPTLFTLALGGLGIVVKVWDWVDRTNELQSWLDANKMTVPGQIGNEFLGAVWVLFIVGLVLWWHDAKSRPRAENPMATDTVQRKLEVAHQERDAAIREREVLRGRFGQIAPLIKTRQALLQIIRLNETFLTIMDEQEAKIKWEDTTHEFMTVVENNKDVFASDYRPQLVKLTTQIKHDFGIVSAALTDVALAHDVYGTGGLKPLLDGMRELANRLRDAIVAVTDQLTVE